MDQLVRIWYARTTEQVADILTKSLAPLLHEDAVLLRSRGLSAHSVFLVVAGCLGPCLYAPVLALLVRARGLAFCLECAFWGSCRCLRIWINNCPASILIGDLSTR